VGSDLDGSRRFPGAFLAPRIPSFADFLASYAPDLLPGSAVRRGPATGAETLPWAPGAPGGNGLPDLPHATTIVTATCDGGVVIAGDRRSTAGNMIAKRDVEKVFRTDEFSAMGIAGTASVGLEFVRLFQVEFLRIFFQFRVLEDILLVVVEEEEAGSTRQGPGNPAQLALALAELGR